MNRSPSKATPVAEPLKAHLSFPLSCWSILTYVKQYFESQTEKRLYSTYISVTHMIIVII